MLDLFSKVNGYFGSIYAFLALILTSISYFDKKLERQLVMNILEELELNSFHNTHSHDFDENDNYDKKGPDQ